MTSLHGGTGLRRFVKKQATDPGGDSTLTAQARPRPGAAPSGDAARPAGPAGQAFTDPAQAVAAERCELCATAMPAVHGHIADIEQASMLCTCRACYLLFSRGQADGSRYRAIPDRYLADPAHPLCDRDWDVLQVPVGLAFFLRSSRRGDVTGFYPSPAGATECKLDLTAWDQLAAEHPLLAAAEPDVEATLVCRSDSGIEAFVVPIDVCYSLAGRMRLHWRGFDGGTEARDSIASFLGTIRTRARHLAADGSADLDHTAAPAQLIGEES